MNKTYTDISYELARPLMKYARLNVSQFKEKYGTYRVYCTFGWYSIHNITHPGYHYIQYKSKFLKSLVYLELDLLWRVVNFFVIPIQQHAYKYVYQRTVDKYPLEREAILLGMDYPELLDSDYRT